MSKELFDKIDSIPIIIQKGWGDESSTHEGYLALIEKANKSISLEDYLESRLNLEEVPSNSGWIKKTYCPFHKQGHERTPSFFINPSINRFNCLACGTNGSVVEYISLKYNRPKLLVAEHILNCVDGKITDDSISARKAAEKRKFNNNVLKLSTMYRNFLRCRGLDNDAIIYANKCMEGFDYVWEVDPTKTESNMEEIVKQLELYFNNYK